MSENNLINNIIIENISNLNTHLNNYHNSSSFTLAQINIRRISKNFEELEVILQN